MFSSETVSSQTRTLIGLFLVLFYAFCRFFLISLIDGLGAYGSYVFEAIFVVMAMFFYRKRIVWVRRPTLRECVEIFIALFLGFMTYEGANRLGLLIPFDFNSGEVLLFLFVIAPILEEFIFRQALWFSIEDLVQRRTVLVVLITAALFGFGHFFAFFYAPLEVHSFILYQTFYTILIGLWWGYRYSISRVILIPILLHVAFNTGFYLHSRF